MARSERRSRKPNLTHGGGGRGFILLDLVLALALFTVGGLAVLAQLDFGLRRVIQAEHRVAAAGVARTALALFESGAMSDRELEGPASAWLDPPEDEGTGDTAQWHCEFDIEPSPWPDLVLASVRVRRVPAGQDAEGQPVLVELRQFAFLRGPDLSAGVAP
ncbi:MAG: hypothetical protein KIT54_04100 [Phycisphaeraceae bacterium]|nr:hypothetical protein [Phycisphaeraceae bacterium]